ELLWDPVISDDRPGEDHRRLHVPGIGGWSPVGPARERQRPGLGPLREDRFAAQEVGKGKKRWLILQRVGVREENVGCFQERFIVRAAGLRRLRGARRRLRRDRVVEGETSGAEDALGARLVGWSPRLLAETGNLLRCEEEVGMRARRLHPRGADPTA